MSRTYKFGGGVLLLPSPDDSYTFIVTYHETTLSYALTNDLEISDLTTIRIVAGRKLLRERCVVETTSFEVSELCTACCLLDQNASSTLRWE
ncbi:hypothetical protein [Allorhodopirellula heiligendammensis]|uniref:Uncharacterized protein n=1 Tax=Allorhodopirellula heiligendammensis TaxID=2714739 RepID=A0A5C6BGA4_9BACT|nr:hypothetical protein [Allorhodopirellula heiligendammensis]TWU10667.1 hypothetical protein Poly21_45730 [Allorhodopirellula heiligendammensis]